MKTIEDLGRTVVLILFASVFVAACSPKNQYERVIEYKGRHYEFPISSVNENLLSLVSELQSDVENLNCISNERKRNFYIETYGKEPPEDYLPKCPTANPFAQKEDVKGDGEVWVVDGCPGTNNYCESLYCKSLPCK